MEFSLTDEQKMIYNTAKEIAEDFGPEYWREKEENEEFPEEYWNALSEAGFQGIIVPEEYGGAEMGLTELIIAMEALCANGCGLSGMWQLCETVIFDVVPTLKFGSEEQKEKYLPKLASGEMEGCMALTEPDAGTNTLNMETRAVKDGDEYVINGSKMFISGIDRADVMHLIARTTPIEEVDKKTEGITEFIVDLPDDSVSYNPIPKHGLNICKTCEVGIDNLRVPENAILGEKGKGWYQVLYTLNPERISFSAGLVGAGELATSLAVDYANEREVFGAPISSHQALQFPLAESYAKLNSAKLLNRKAAWLFDENASSYEIGKATNLAKATAVKAAEETVYNAMQCFGGYGYTKEYDVERLMREVELMSLAPVTQQMTLAFIGEHILGMEKSY